MGSASGSPLRGRSHFSSLIPRSPSLEDHPHRRVRSNLEASTRGKPHVGPLREAWTNPSRESRKSSLNWAWGSSSDRDFDSGPGSLRDRWDVKAGEPDPLEGSFLGPDRHPDPRERRDRTSPRSAMPPVRTGWPKEIRRAPGSARDANDPKQRDRGPKVRSSPSKSRRILGRNWYPFLELVRSSRCRRRETTGESNGFHSRKTCSTAGVRTG